MGVSADLISILAATTAVTSLLGINKKTATKSLRPGKLDPEDVFTATLGAVELHIESNDYPNDLESSGGAAVVRVLVDCVSQSVKTSNAIANAIETRLEPFKGATPGGRINAVELVDRREDWASTEDGRSIGDYVVELEISVFYQKN